MSGMRKGDWILFTTDVPKPPLWRIFRRISWWLKPKRVTQEYVIIGVTDTTLTHAPDDEKPQA